MYALVSMEMENPGTSLRDISTEPWLVYKEKLRSY